MDEFIQIALFILFALFSLGSNLLNKRKKKQDEARRAQEEMEGESRPSHPGRPSPGRPHPGRPRRRTEVSSPDVPEERERQPSTFEDILRELTGIPPSDTAEQKKRQVQRRGAEADDDYEHPFSSSNPNEKLEKAKQEAKQRTKPLEKYGTKAKEKVPQKISDKINIEDELTSKKLVVKTERSVAKNKGLARSIAASLKDPNGARKAIILGEIINKKYF